MASRTKACQTLVREHSLLQTMKFAKIIFEILACSLTACASISGGLKDKNGKEHVFEVTQLDSIVVMLSEIRGLDQGLRDSPRLYFNNNIEFNLHSDSLCFSKAIWIIERYGYINDLGKYSTSFEYLLETLPAVLLHNPQRLTSPDIYNLLKREIRAGRMSAEFVATLLDKYYVMKEKRTLYFSDFRQWLECPYPMKKDQALSDSLRQDLGLSALPDSLFVQ